MIALVVGSAILLGALQSFGGIFASLLFLIAALIVCGGLLKDWSWRLVAWTWASAFLISLLLPQSYGWTLPLFGAVPGLPDDFIRRGVEVAVIVMVLAGAVLSLSCLILGTFLQRILSLPPALPLLLLFFSLVAALVF
jgi:hypothetical protein